MNEITRFFYQPIHEAGIDYLGYIMNMYSGKRLCKVRLVRWNKIKPPWEEVPRVDALTWKEEDKRREDFKN